MVKLDKTGDWKSRFWNPGNEFISSCPWRNLLDDVGTDDNLDILTCFRNCIEDLGTLKMSSSPVVHGGISLLKLLKVLVVWRLMTILTY